MSDERREYIRHPVNVPIHVFLQSDKKLKYFSMSDVGEGGVAFQTNVAFEDGTILKVNVPHVQPPFEAACVVCWRQVKDDGFEIGVKFLDEDSRFRARMVEQVCHIEGYRQTAIKEGRSLSAQEAACEWISLYAADFGGH